MHIVLLGRKVAMFSGIDKYYVKPATLVDITDCVVAQKKLLNQVGPVILVGYGRKKRHTKAEIGEYKELGYVPYKVKQVKVPEGLYDKLDVGSSLYNVFSDLLSVGSRVDVSGVSKGKGFAGVIKRHGFSRQPKTHGQSDRTRAPGAIGAQTPGRVWKGKKMPGRMGGVRTTIRNLEILDLVDVENRKYLVVKGGIPGPYGSIVEVKFKMEDA